MYKPIFLRTENELNKLLRKQKKSKQGLSILFTSLWDGPSQDLVAKIKFRELYNRHIDYREPLYIVDSYTMPHAFVIFKTSKLPHYVQLKKSSVNSVDYLPHIYEALGL
jgi:hypothetical protein